MAEFRDLFVVAQAAGKDYYGHTKYQIFWKRIIAWYIMAGVVYALYLRNKVGVPMPAFYWGGAAILWPLLLVIQLCMLAWTIISTPI